MKNSIVKVINNVRTENDFWRYIERLKFIKINPFPPVSTFMFTFNKKKKKEEEENNLITHYK